MAEDDLIHILGEIVYEQSIKRHAESLVAQKKFRKG